jgi:sugar (pentulose or hexulose) kinase
MTCVVGTDIGTTSTKSVVVDVESGVYRRILADVTGYQVVHASRSSEAPGGDALIAALAAKEIRDAGVIKDWLRLDEAKVIEPDERAHKRYLDYFEKV